MLSARGRNGRGGRHWNSSSARGSPDQSTGAHPQIKVVTKLANRSSAITGLKRVSRPGLRRYVGAKDIPRVLGGMGVAILSTPRGILTGHEAKRQNVGGELVAYVW